ncbi:MAG: pectate lyase [Verrucomicrobiales bacterium]|nr:pectate lyase [Verrucomicrobiales bacterium]
MKRLLPCLAFWVSLTPVFGAPDRGEVIAALKKAVTYYSNHAALRGGYVYYYSPDFTRRLGEGEATATEIWVQPPGTPAVGGAFLRAYEATGDRFYLDLAKEAGAALRHGQLESGGWRNSIDFDASGPRADRYRDGRGNGGKGKNFSTLDDDITQSALRFLIALDAATGFEDAATHEAVKFALENLLAAQFPNGAFPQGWTGPVESRQELPASFPGYDWRTEGRIKNYWDQYTLNDGAAGTITDLLIAAHETYEDPKFLEALTKLGEFLIQAQLPAPQRAWAQQYGPEMHPIWARAFEPPAVSGRESEDAMIALLKIADHTGENRFLEPVVPGVKYLESSLLKDGQLARYYELETNRPLYMKRSGKVYELTHDDSSLPDHYGWKNPHQLEWIKAGYRRLAGGKSLKFADGTAVDVETVALVLKALDDQGRWITKHDPDGPRLVGQPKFQPGEEYLSSAVFVENVNVLSAFLKP